MFEDFGESNAESEGNYHVDPKSTEEAIASYAARLGPPGAWANRASIATVLYDADRNVERKRRACIKRFGRCQRFKRR